MSTVGRRTPALELPSDLPGQQPPRASADTGGEGDAARAADASAPGDGARTDAAGCMDGAAAAPSLAGKKIVTPKLDLPSSAAALATRDGVHPSEGLLHHPTAPISTGPYNLYQYSPLPVGGGIGALSTPFAGGGGVAPFMMSMGSMGGLGGSGLCPGPR
eukprot:TRINITY_DN511_c0_g1_i2.p4 TRINITY_DN511_c0_g1~~TRINITY_DN511_c0_g1_i2.p4  ORF type:complete len:160 (+),score=36.78 TRINITY_DN511_c0_g1_i2:438-917(+)